MITTYPTAPDIKVVIDLDGVIRQATVANDVSDEAMDDWLGRPWVDTVAGIDRRQLSELVDGTIKEGVSPFFQLTQRFPSGLAVPFEYMTVRLDDRSGLVAIGRDVRAVAQLQSRLAAAQQTMERGYWQLREAENRYRALYEASTDAMLLVVPGDLTIAEANPSAISALGLVSGRVEQVAGRSILDRVDAPDVALVKATLERAAERGKTPRIVAHFGPNRDAWLMNVSALDDEQGQLLLVQLLPAADAREVPVTHDEPRRFAVDWVEQSPDGIAVLNERGRIEQVNPAFLELIQEGADVDVVGTELGKWLGRPGGDSHMLFDSLRRNGTVRLFPMTIHGSLGARTEVEVAAAIKNRSRPALIGIYVRDVSRRVNSTQQLDKLGQLLSSMIGQVGKTRLKGMVSTTVGLLERHYIEAALDSTDGNRTAAARMLGLSRQSLYVKLARYGIDGGGDEKSH